MRFKDFVAGHCGMDNLGCAAESCIGGLRKNGESIELRTKLSQGDPA